MKKTVIKIFIHLILLFILIYLLMYESDADISYLYANF